MKNKRIRTAGMILSLLSAALLMMDGIMKLIRPEEVVQATLELGYPESTILTIGILLIISTALYLYPRTALWGALFITAFLGGAVATHVRVQNPLFSHILFPVYIAVFVWAGLLMRRPTLRKLFLLKIDAPD